MVINFGVKKSGCGESVGLVPFSAKYLNFSRQRDPYRQTDSLTDMNTLALRRLEELPDRSFCFSKTLFYFILLA